MVQAQQRPALGPGVGVPTLIHHFDNDKNMIYHQPGTSNALLPVDSPSVNFYVKHIRVELQAYRHVAAAAPLRVAAVRSAPFVIRSKASTIARP